MTPIVGAIGRREERSIWGNLKRFLESPEPVKPDETLRGWI